MTTGKRTRAVVGAEADARPAATGADSAPPRIHADTGAMAASTPDGAGDAPPWIHPHRLSPHARYPSAMPCALGPPEAFSNEPARPDYFDLWPGHDPAWMGPNSVAVRLRICRSCAGWNRKPTPQEFYEAIRAQQPTPRQMALIAMWAVEASQLDIFDAWGEHVYTFRQLVAAFHRAGPLNAFTTFRFLNRMALVPECNGIPLWTD